MIKIKWALPLIFFVLSIENVHVNSNKNYIKYFASRSKRN